jgi:hypothetical protein
LLLPAVPLAIVGVNLLEIDTTLSFASSRLDYVDKRTLGPGQLVLLQEAKNVVAVVLARVIIEPAANDGTWDQEQRLSVRTQH